MEVHALGEVPLVLVNQPLVLVRCCRGLREARVAPGQQVSLFLPVGK